MSNDEAFVRIMRNIAITMFLWFSIFISINTGILDFYDISKKLNNNKKIKFLTAY